MTDETIRELIKKVNALAEGGFQGERAAAAAMLEKLLKKYDLTIEEVLAEEKTEQRDFTFKNKLERRLLIQIYGRVTGRSKVSTWHWKGGISFEVTPAQYVEMAELYKYYRVALQEEIETLFQAFIQKHGLVAPASGDGEDEEMTEAEREQLRRMFQMMKGLPERPRPNTRLLEKGG